MKKATEMVVLGRNSKRFEGAVNPPVYHTSTVLFDTMEELEAYEAGQSNHIGYGRNGNPTMHALMEAIQKLEGADYTQLFPSGLSSIVTALMAYSKAGQHVLMPDAVYGPSRHFCDHELSRFGVETTYYSNTEDALTKLRDNTAILFIEAPGSLTFEMVDIPALCEAAHAKGAIVIGDNTWATPLGMDAFALGMDVSMQSATKYISGHSDLCMGALSVREPHVKPLKRLCRNTGHNPSADECYLALRGLRTMGLRLAHHQRSALEVAKWLQQRPEVTRVAYPALPDDPGHALWKRDMTAACGLFSFELVPHTREQRAAMLNGLEHFGMGYSWGGYESLVIPVNPSKIRTVTEWEENVRMLRVHIGLEAVEDLLGDLEEGFARFNKA